jgi:hypothetical protein|tara:strand:- start:292 stop:741 length:450 start_codon:yes stop_codon:yes gene_type:complete
MKNFVIIIALVFSVVIADAQDEAKVNGPEIFFKKTTHDYGTIDLNGDGTYNFEFTNIGNEPLILSKPRSSCGCTVPSWPKEPILPGETNKIKVTYNTHKSGAFNKTVTVFSNSKKKSTTLLRIKGKVEKKPNEALPEKNNSAGATPINK